MNHEKALYIKIADDIIFDINAETLKPNSILPLQSEYARAYNTSLGTVKKAYALLKKRGLIKTVKGHGTIVRGAIKSLDFATDSFRDTIAAGSGTAETRVISAGWSYANGTVADNLCISPAEPYFKIQLIRLVNQQAICLQRIYIRNEVAVRLSLERRNFSLESLFALYCSIWSKRDLYSIKRMHAINCPPEICQLLETDESIPVLFTRSRLYHDENIIEFYESFERTDLCAPIYRKTFSDR